MGHAAELEIGQVPAGKVIDFELKIISLSLEVEQRHHLLVVPDGVRNYGPFADADEATPVVERTTAIDLLVAKFQELVRLVDFRNPHDRIVDCEHFKLGVAAHRVDLVEQFALGLGHEERLNTGHVANIRRQVAQKPVEQFQFDNSHGTDSFRLS
uniref:(northern house mosquito) hypothetical protein n=1 Tax=Culex pipiens TaxID=7175 RepID=A0A8D8P7D5_CULPI